MTFFDLDRVGDSIRFVRRQDIVNGTLDKLLERIIAEVETTTPGLVFVDSFRTVTKWRGPGRGPRFAALRAAAWPSV